MEQGKDVLEEADREADLLEQILEDSCEPDCPSCESCDGRRAISASPRPLAGGPNHCGCGSPVLSHEGSDLEVRAMT